MKREKEKLYRKENKKALHYCGNIGSEYRYERHTKIMNNFEGDHKSIKKTQGGYDYTPLFKFLLSKVGKKWDDIYSEAVSRLDNEEPIWWMVYLDIDNNYKYYRDIVRIGESTYYSALTVDENGILVKINKDAKYELPEIVYGFTTYTFNGKVIK